MTEPKLIFQDRAVRPLSPLENDTRQTHIDDLISSLNALTAEALSGQLEADIAKACEEVTPANTLTGTPMVKPTKGLEDAYDVPTPAQKPATGLPTAAAARKAIPIYSGCLKYFPDALAAVAELSRVGNDQHNPGKPLQWDRSKSGDELDALSRHLLEAGTIDTDGIRHSAKVAWRALANLQKELENSR